MVHIFLDLSHESGDLSCEVVSGWIIHVLCHRVRLVLEDELLRPHGGCQIIDSRNSTIEYCVFETVDNLLDRKSRDEHEILNTRGVPAKRSMTVKLARWKENMESWNNVTATGR